MSKREDYISWDDYFMGVAVLASQRSKDPSTQVGACIVTPDKKIVGVGYNGFPNTKPGLDADEILPWGKGAQSELENKYLYVVHAEPNAILNANGKVDGCVMYLTWFPCADCSKYIIQSGIKKLIYLHEHATERYATSMKAAKIMLDLAGVKYEKFIAKQKHLTINFE